MQLSEARTELKARGFDQLSDARCTTFLNNAKNELEDVYPWPWLETSTSGTAPLTISDLKHVLYVVDDTNDRELRGLDLREVITADPGLTSTGSPEHWYLDGTTTLKVHPANTSVTLSVRYVKFSAELSLDADTPGIPTRFHPVWVDLAVVEAYKDSDNFQAANALLADVTRRIGQMLATYANRDLQAPALQTVTFASEDW